MKSLPKFPKELRKSLKQKRLNRAGSELIEVENLDDLDLDLLGIRGVKNESNLGVQACIISKFHLKYICLSELLAGEFLAVQVLL